MTTILFENSEKISLLPLKYLTFTTFWEECQLIAIFIPGKNYLLRMFYFYVFYVVILC